MNTSTLTTSITIPKMDLSLLKDLAKKFGWTINNTSQQMSGLKEALKMSRQEMYFTPIVQKT